MLDYTQRLILCRDIDKSQLIITCESSSEITLDVTEDSRPRLDEDSKDGMFTVKDNQDKEAEVEEIDDEEEHHGKNKNTELKENICIYRV